MSTLRLPPPLLSIAYAEAARDYLRSLPPEHFMEATSQGTQRKITLESLDLVHARRPEVQVFNELLVQYPYRGQEQPRQVVPDNMVVIWKEPIKAEGSFDIPLQPARPFWVLEYVSKHNKRKDYIDSYRKYERELKVPYCLLFYPEAQDLRLFHHSGRRYLKVEPNKKGLCAIPKLSLEIGLRDSWVRFWYKGGLLPLPGELQRDLDKSNRRAEKAERELQQLREQLAKLQGPQTKANGRKKS